MDSTWLRGSTDAISIPLTEFKNMAGAVLSGTPDTEHTGTVLSLDSSDSDRIVENSYGAFVQNVLEGTAATANALNETEDYDFDPQFTMGGIFYQLERSSGVFSREADVEFSVYQLKPNWLDVCLSYWETTE